MSYYPLLIAPHCKGYTVIHNYSPNNWEFCSRKPKKVNVTWSFESLWHSLTLCELPYNSSISFSRDNLPSLIPKGSFPFFSLSDKFYPTVTSDLPLSPSLTSYPLWRATLSLSSLTAPICTSYQGEIDPFPTNSSFLSIAPLLQFHPLVENYLIFMNLQSDPLITSSELSLHDLNRPGDLLGTFYVNSNSVTSIPIPTSLFSPDSLPAFVCKGLAGIPLYFSRSLDGSSLSLEHTHPPASYVIHGNRWAAQKLIKSTWFHRLS